MSSERDDDEVALPLSVGFTDQGGGSLTLWAIFDARSRIVATIGHFPRKYNADDTYKRPEPVERIARALASLAPQPHDDARTAVIEECAKVCDTRAAMYATDEPWRIMAAEARTCAACIRALVAARAGGGRGDA